MRLPRLARAVLGASLFVVALSSAACSEPPLSRVDPPAEPVVAAPAEVYLVLDGRAEPIPPASVYWNRLWRIVDSTVRADRGGTIGGRLADEPLREPALSSDGGPLADLPASGVRVVLWYPEQTDVYVASDRAWRSRLEGRPFDEAMRAWGMPAERRYDGTSYRVKEISLSVPERSGEGTGAALAYVLANRVAPGSDPYRLLLGVSSRRIDTSVYDPTRDVRELVGRYRQDAGR